MDPALRGKEVVPGLFVLGVYDGGSFSDHLRDKGHTRVKPEDFVHESECVLEFFEIVRVGEFATASGVGFWAHPINFRDHFVLQVWSESERGDAVRDRVGSGFKAR